MHIADVRLVDGSKENDSNTTEYASLPLTLFFKDAAELASFKQYVGKTPLLFMCLTGSSKDGKVSVATLKDQSWRQEAVGPKAVVMAEEAARMCGDDAALKDVAALQTFTAAAAVDYSSPMATLTACHLVDPMCATPASLLGDGTEHLYQCCLVGSEMCIRDSYRAPLPTQPCVRDTTYQGSQHQNQG